MARPILRSVLIVLAALFATGAAHDVDAQSKQRVLILVVDGLRPDYVTPALMPRLNALAERGVRGLNHHAVFPTVTRVNAPSIFTGRHPGGHGLLGNTVYIPDVAADRILSAADAADLRAIDDATGGRLLTAPSLGELLARRGLVFFAASSGSEGSATLMNHRGAGAGLVHHAVTLPDSLGPIVRSLLGPVPEIPDGAPEIPRVARAVDAVLRIGLDRADADVLAAWLTEPDNTAHAHGIGSPETVAILREVDDQIGRLLDGLGERGVLSSTDILVTSDHGFSTRVGKQNIESLLVSAGLKASDNSTDVIVAGDAIHVREGGPERIARIVMLLQSTDWIGPVFTRAREPGADLGVIPGTLSFAAIGWDHGRSADILVSGNWSDLPNRWGYAGSVLVPGVAGHGTSSPWDIRATFIAAGPRIKEGGVSHVPTGNIDITPTTLHLTGVPVPSDIDGRVLSELLRDGPDPSEMRVTGEPVSTEVSRSGVTYRLTANRSRVGNTRYLDGTRVERIGESDVTFVAHRGGIVPGHPENTLSAFRNAIAHGVHAIEIDLRATRDGEVVILHDETVDRTTNGHGSVGSLTSGDVRALDAGGGERIPAYAEVLEVVAGTRVQLLLDIKESPQLDRRKVVRLTEQHGATTRVIVGVRSIDDLHTFRNLDPDLRTLGLVASIDQIEPFIGGGVDVIRLWPEWIDANGGLIQKIHGLGKPVWVTAGDAPLAELERLVQLGVDGVLSDSPALASPLLAFARRHRR